MHKFSDNINYFYILPRSKDSESEFNKLRVNLEAIYNDQSQSACSMSNNIGKISCLYYDGLENLISAEIFDIVLYLDTVAPGKLSMKEGSITEGYHCFYRDEKKVQISSENEDEKKEFEYFYQQINNAKIPPMYEFLQRIMAEGESKQKKQAKREKLNRQQRQKSRSCENDEKELKIFETIELVKK